MTAFFAHESAVIDPSAAVGDRTKIWHFCHIQDKASVGADCVLGQNVYIGSNVQIGNGCKIQNNVSLYSGVILEDQVFCGPSCVFTNDLTPRAGFFKGSAGWVSTIVRKGASIGANATIVCGCELGKWSMVGAGAVVTKDVRQYSLVVGVPARHAGWVCMCGHPLDGNLKCSACSRSYERRAEELHEMNQCHI